MTSPDDLLRAYDDQLRARAPTALPAGAFVEHDGPLLRLMGLAGRSWVLYRDVGALGDAALDELIARQIRVFTARSEPFEWKLHSHDRPDDLPARLRAAGFVPEQVETVVIARVESLATNAQPPAGVAVRDVTERADFERIVAMEESVWGESHAWLADMLEGERAANPDSLAVVVAEGEGAVVSAAWVRFELGTEFATLWGGATLPEWRGRGIYRELVAYRARLAAARGFRYLQVDASDDSRPILERLGFVAVATTTPYVWAPV